MTTVRVIHVDDVPVERMDVRDGWAISEFRLPISGAQGSSTTMFHARFRPGSKHAKHRHRHCDELTAYPPGAALDPYRFRTAEQLYLVTAGSGSLRSGGEVVTLRAGHAVFVPSGEELAIANQSPVDALHLVGLLTGAGSLDETGCVDAQP